MRCASLLLLASAYVSVQAQDGIGTPEPPLVDPDFVGACFASCQAALPGVAKAYCAQVDAVAPIVSHVCEVTHVSGGELGCQRACMHEDDTTPCGLINSEVGIQQQRLSSCRAYENVLPRPTLVHTCMDAHIHGVEERCRRQREWVAEYKRNHSEDVGVTASIDESGEVHYEHMGEDDEYDEEHDFEEGHDHAEHHDGEHDEEHDDAHMHEDGHDEYEGHEHDEEHHHEHGDEHHDEQHDEHHDEHFEEHHEHDDEHHDHEGHEDEHEDADHGDEEHEDGAGHEHEVVHEHDAHGHAAGESTEHHGDASAKATGGSAASPEPTGAAEGGVVAENGAVPAPSMTADAIQADVNATAAVAPAADATATPAVAQDAAAAVPSSVSEVASNSSTA